MDSNFTGPVNIGSEEMVTINELVDTVAKVSGKTVHKINIDGPTGFVVATLTMILFAKNLDGIIPQPLKRVSAKLTIGLMIKLVILDVDGVMTDGVKYYDKEQ